MKADGTRPLLAAAMIVLGAGGSAIAIQLSVHENNSQTLRAVLARGAIEKGDLLKLQAFLSRMPERRRTAVYLDSPGGDLYEGLKLGRFFYDFKIKTVIEGNGSTCASACALAFLGGRDVVSGQPWRAKSSTSRLGFHSFAATFDNTRSYSGKDMEAVLQRAQRIVLDVADYLRAIGTDLDFLRTMFRAPSDDMNWIANNEAVTIGIHVWDENGKELVGPIDR